MTIDGLSWNQYRISAALLRVVIGVDLAFCPLFEQHQKHCTPVIDISQALIVKVSYLVCTVKSARKFM